MKRIEIWIWRVVFTFATTIAVLDAVVNHNVLGMLFAPPNFILAYHYWRKP